MRSINCRQRFAAIVIVAVSAVAPALASQRTFVSTSGVDNATCSLAAPCRTFSAALSAVNAGGEIVALDSGGYGPVAIGKSVTIEAPAGVYAGITVSAGDGIAVAAAASDKIVLRGLAITGQGGVNGIHIQTAGAVHVERCTVSGLAKGIFFEPSAISKLVVADTVVRGNSSYGILAQPAAGGVASRVEVWRSEVTQNGADGIIFVDLARASVGDTLSANNNGAGLWFASTALSSADVHAAVDRAQLVGNLAGVVAFGASVLSAVTLTNSMIANTNGAGLLANNGGRIELAGNQIAGNDTGTLIVGSGAIESTTTNLRVRNTTPGDPAAPLTPY